MESKADRQREIMSVLDHQPYSAVRIDDHGHYLIGGLMPTTNRPDILTHQNKLVFVQTDPGRIEPASVDLSNLWKGHYSIVRTPDDLRRVVGLDHR